MYQRTSVSQSHYLDNRHIMDRMASIQHLAPQPRFGIPQTVTRQVYLPTVGPYDPISTHDRTKPDVIPSIDVDTVLTRGDPSRLAYQPASQYTFGPTKKPYQSITTSNYLLGPAPIDCVYGVNVDAPSRLFGNSGRVNK